MSGIAFVMRSVSVLRLRLRAMSSATPSAAATDTPTTIAVRPYRSSSGPPCSSITSIPLSTASFTTRACASKSRGEMPISLGQRADASVYRAQAVSVRCGPRRIPSGRLRARSTGAWGHTASSFAAGTALTMFYPRVAPLLYTLAAGVGCPTSTLGHHFPSDIAVGAATGTGTGAIVAWGLRRARLLQGPTRT
jgi:hypothetical protein